jgi:hypothetical protein
MGEYCLQCNVLTLCRLNAVREICARCPLAMTEDLLGDLVQYKNYRNKGMYVLNNLTTLLNTDRAELNQPDVVV